MYEKGLKRRRQAETTLNLNSSRSHSILTVTVVRVPYDEETDEVYQTERDITKYSSALHFVDLAGSERQQRTKAMGLKIIIFFFENHFSCFISRKVIGSPNLIFESLSRAKMCC